VAKKSLTSLWLEANDPKYRKVPNGGAGGKEAKDNGSRAIRIRRGISVKQGYQSKESIRAFVERHRHAVEHDCIFVPAALKGAPASLAFCDKVITASKYMLLLTQGTAKFDGAHARHLCGNGHMSCVNPAHLTWGTAGDNLSDAGRHRAAGDNVQDRINSVTRD
jgi:hypothetical protein